MEHTSRLEILVVFLNGTREHLGILDNQTSQWWTESERIRICRFLYQIRDWLLENGWADSPLVSSIDRVVELVVRSHSVILEAKRDVIFEFIKITKITIPLLEI